MTTDNRTIPVSWTDSLLDIRSGLEAYIHLSTAFIEKLSRDCSSGDALAVVNGSEMLSKPILSGLSELIAEVDSRRVVMDKIALRGSQGPSHD